LILERREVSRSDIHRVTEYPAGSASCASRRGTPSGSRYFSFQENYSNMSLVKNLAAQGVCEEELV
jgi:hypothetical protein